MFFSADKFFTTAHILDTLWSHNLYGCGTTRPTRRGFPETLKKVSLTEGNMRSASGETSWHLSGWTRSLLPCSPHSPRQMSPTPYKEGREMAGRPLYSVLTQQCCTTSTWRVWIKVISTNSNTGSDARAAKTTCTSFCNQLIYLIFIHTHHHAQQSSAAKGLPPVACRAVCRQLQQPQTAGLIR